MCFLYTCVSHFCWSNYPVQYRIETNEIQCPTDRTSCNHMIHYLFHTMIQKYILQRQKTDALPTSVMWNVNWYEVVFMDWIELKTVQLIDDSSTLGFRSKIQHISWMSSYFNHGSHTESTPPWCILTGAYSVLWLVDFVIKSTKRTSVDNSAHAITFAMSQSINSGPGCIICTRVI